MDKSLKLQIFFGWRKAVLALPILAFTSALVPPCLLMMLPMYVKSSTSSSGFSFSTMGDVLVVLTFRTLLFPLWMLRPRWVEFSTTMLVFSCICCWVWKRRAKSSAKSRSSSWFHRVHWMAFRFSTVDVFMTQSMASRNKNGDNKQPCRTPVCTRKASVSWPLWTTLQVSPS